MLKSLGLIGLMAPKFSTRNIGKAPYLVCQKLTWVFTSVHHRADTPLGNKAAFEARSVSQFVLFGNGNEAWAASFVKFHFLKGLLFRYSLRYHTLWTPKQIVNIKSSKLHRVEKYHLFFSAVEYRRWQLSVRSVFHRVNQYSLEFKFFITSWARG